MEIKIITSDPNAQVYKDGKLLSGTPSTGGGTDKTYPAGPPPNMDSTFVMEWPNNQADKDFTLGQYLQTVRFVVPTVSNPGKPCWLKVYGHPPGGESFLNSRLIKNNVLQRTWFPPDALTINLQEDFCVSKGIPNQNIQLWLPGDVIDFQFKTQEGVVQPVRFSLFTGEPA